MLIFHFPLCRSLPQSASLTAPSSEGASSFPVSSVCRQAEGTVSVRKQSLFVLSETKCKCLICKGALPIMTASAIAANVLQNTNHRFNLPVAFRIIKGLIFYDFFYLFQRLITLPFHNLRILYFRKLDPDFPLLKRTSQYFLKSFHIPPRRVLISTYTNSVLFLCCIVNSINQYYHEVQYVFSAAA